MDTVSFEMLQMETLTLWNGTRDVIVRSCISNFLLVAYGLRPAFYETQKIIGEVLAYLSSYPSFMSAIVESLHFLSLKSRPKHYMVITEQHDAIRSLLELDEIAYQAPSMDAEKMVGPAIGAALGYYCPRAIHGTYAQYSVSFELVTSPHHKLTAQLYAYSCVDLTRDDIAEIIQQAERTGDRYKVFFVTAFKLPVTVRTQFTMFS